MIVIVTVFGSYDSDSVIISSAIGYFFIGIWGMKLAKGEENMKNRALDCLALTIAIIGAVNWGLIGLFSFDLVAFIFGNMSWFSRIIYALVGIAGLYIITFYMYTGGTAESHKA